MNSVLFMIKSPPNWRNAPPKSEEVSSMKSDPVIYLGHGAVNNEWGWLCCSESGSEGLPLFAADSCYSGQSATQPLRSAPLAVRESRWLVKGSADEKNYVNIKGPQTPTHTQ